MVDNKTGDPLPFGTLGKHKAGGFKDATPCLFVFDCIYYNGESLMNKPIKERRRLLEKHMVEVGNHVKFSEMQHITQKSQLGDMIKRVLKQGLEGLVLKDVKSPYEPGKRHWLKVKKDYLNEGAMADSADLVVLGGWYGTGNRGGQISIFLMGCYDEFCDKWRTVTKVHTGLDDKTLEWMQGELMPNMDKIKQDYDSVPKWLDCTRQLTPDFVAKKPKKSPVWEITGAEFTKSDIHTAGGISIRFPRITKRRDDKTWETATSLVELKNLYKASKESTDFDIDYATTSSDLTTEDEVKKEKVKIKEEDDDIEMEEKEKLVVKEEIKEEDDDDVEMEEIENSRREVNTKATVTGKHSYNKTRIETEFGLVLTVAKGDVFTAGKNVSLAHCISKDCRLGKGIAKIFRDKFGRIDELKKSGTDIGGVATLMDGKRFIYNLVTKAKYSDKPTYESLRQSLESMRSHAIKNGVAEIAVPKIGCGLDGLQWNAVRTLVKNVFLKDKISITVYTLDDNPVASEKPAVLPKNSPLKTTPAAKSRKVKTESSQPSVKDMLSNNGGKRKSTDNDDANNIAKKGKREAEEASDLPDVFDDVKVVLLDGVAKIDKMKRYVIAFGGEVLPEFQSASAAATHIVYPKGHSGLCKIAADTATHVYEEWLVQSIKRKKMQNCDMFEL
jgi:O-acetyl-ADP-ribose deacetylase (regulator of RNase III)